MKKLSKILSVVLAVIIALSSLCIFASAQPAEIYNIEYNKVTHVLSWTYDGEEKVDHFNVRIGEYCIETTKTSVNISKLFKEIAKNDPELNEYIEDNDVHISVWAMDSENSPIETEWEEICLKNSAEDLSFFAKVGNFFMSIIAFFGDIFAPSPILLDT